MEKLWSCWRWILELRKQKLRVSNYRRRFLITLQWETLWEWGESSNNRFQPRVQCKCVATRRGTNEFQRKWEFFPQRLYSYRIKLLFCSWDVLRFPRNLWIKWKWGRNWWEKCFSCKKWRHFYFFRL